MDFGADYGGYGGPHPYDSGKWKIQSKTKQVYNACLHLHQYAKAF
jgi:hypothetical protein